VDGNFLYFALGKYDQPIHEDLGDKSVFEFLALSEEKQQEFLRERERDWSKTGSVKKRVISE